MIFGAIASRSGAFEQSERHALERLYARATEQAERSFQLDEDGRRRLANIVVFTYRSAMLEGASNDGDATELQLLDECLRRFTPLQQAISRVLRRRVA